MIIWDPSFKHFCRFLTFPYASSVCVSLYQFSNEKILSGTPFCLPMVDEGGGGGFFQLPSQSR